MTYPNTRREKRTLGTSGYIASLEFDRKKLRQARLIGADSIEAVEAFKQAKTPDEVTRATADLLSVASRLAQWQARFNK